MASTSYAEFWQTVDTVVLEQNAGKPTLQKSRSPRTKIKPARKKSKLKAPKTTKITKARLNFGGFHKIVSLPSPNITVYRFLLKGGFLAVFKRAGPFNKTGTIYNYNLYGIAPGVKHHGEVYKTVANAMLAALNGAYSDTAISGAGF